MFHIVLKCLKIGLTPCVVMSFHRQCHIYYSQSMREEETGKPLYDHAVRVKTRGCFYKCYDPVMSCQLIDQFSPLGTVFTSLASCTLAAVKGFFANFRQLLAISIMIHPVLILVLIGNHRKYQHTHLFLDISQLSLVCSLFLHTKPSSLSLLPFRTNFSIPSRSPCQHA